MHQIALYRIEIACCDQVAQVKRAQRRWEARWAEFQAPQILSLPWSMQAHGIDFEMLKVRLLEYRTRIKRIADCCVSLVQVAVVYIVVSKGKGTKTCFKDMPESMYQAPKNGPVQGMLSLRLVVAVDAQNPQVTKDGREFPNLIAILPPVCGIGKRWRCW